MSLCVAASTMPMIEKSDARPIAIAASRRGSVTPTAARPTTATRTANGSKKYSSRLRAEPLSIVHVSESDENASSAAIE